MLALLAVVASPPGAADPAAKPDVTFVGDSISASLDHVPSARRVLAHPFDTTFDLAVRRRLVTPGCSFEGKAPTNALEAVEARGCSVGDGRGCAGSSESPVPRARRGVVWVTLREAYPVYRPTNAAIRREARRWRSVEVTDWDALGRGRPWFREDGLHPNAAGANALARLIRSCVARVARTA